MTRDEIRKAAFSLDLSPICRDDFDVDDLERVKQDIATFSVALVRQAYEKAAEAAYSVAKKYDTEDLLREKRTAHEVADSIRTLAAALEVE